MLLIVGGGMLVGTVLSLLCCSIVDGGICGSFGTLVVVLFHLLAPVVCGSFVVVSFRLSSHLSISSLWHLSI